jgi:hypothetical protein
LLTDTSPAADGAFVNGWKALDRLPQTDPRDAGCDETMELLHVYAELVAIDRAQVDQRYPEVAANLRSCTVRKWS